MKKVLCLFIGILSISCLYSQKYKQLSLKDKLKILQLELAARFKIPFFHPETVDIDKFKNLLESVNALGKLKTENFVDGDSIICRLCPFLVTKGLKYFSLKTLGMALCKMYMVFRDWEMNYNGCLEITMIHEPIIEYIIKNSEIFNSEYACSVLLQKKNCYHKHPALTWLTKIPDSTQNTHENKRPREPSCPPKPLKILYLGDIHISHDYEVGGIVNCGYTICCKHNLGRGHDILHPKYAGTWGDYVCDMSLSLYSTTLHHLKHTHKDIDLIYFTGDIIDHSHWRNSITDNEKDISYLFDTLADTFPNITVLPAIGNHESIPSNMFSPETVDERFSQKWLYDLNAKLWSRWLPEKALDTVKKQGYYAISPHTKLRIIVLNNNVCYVYNWWLLYSTDFLKEQLDFLKEELLEAENEGQFVHILGHVFPGEKECVEPWEVNYNLLITRFAHIIKGQFFGHTHYDGLKVFYSKQDGKPINVAYNGGSLTPHTKNNPNYKIISVDPDTFDVLDIDTYSFNLTEANLYPDKTPRWKKLYSLKEDYGLNDLTPEIVDLLPQLLPHYRPLFDKYWRFSVREGDEAIKEGCDARCKRNLIFSIKRTVSITSQ